MAKLTLVDLTSLANASSAVNTINENSDAIVEALENTLSRDGTTPNEMLADLDMNSYSLLNVADPVAETDGVNLRSIRPLVSDAIDDIVQDAMTATHMVEKFTATASQTTFPLGGSPDVLNNTIVFDDGLHMIPGEDYTLVNGNTIEFAVGRAVGHEITVRYLQTLPVSSGDADGISYTLTAAYSYERTVGARLGERVSVLDFIPPALHTDIRAGTNTDNLSTYIQAALDSLYNTGGVVYFPSGTYHARGLYVYSNTTLQGDGKAVSILKAHSTMTNAEFLLRNETINNLTRVDHDISLRDMTFDGNGLWRGSATRDSVASLVNFGCVTNIDVSHCRFTNYGYSGISISHTIKPRVKDCEFDNLCYDGVEAVANRGPSLYISSFTGATLFTEDAQVEGCYFHDNAWSNHFSSVGGYINDNIVENCGESGIYLTSRTSSQDAAFLCRDIECRGNTIRGTYVNFVAGSGIESARVQDAIIADNRISECELDGISLTDNVNVQVLGNTIRNTSLASATRGGISMFSVASAPTAPTNIMIRNNRVYDNQGTATMNHAVGYLGGGGTAPTYVSVHYNDFVSPTAFLKGVYNFTTSSFYKSATLSRGYNLPGTDNIVQFGSFTVPVTAAPANELLTFNFPPSRVEFIVMDAGAGGSEVRVSNGVLLRDGTTQLMGYTQDETGIDVVANPANRAVRILSDAGVTQADGVTSANTFTETGTPIVYGATLVFATTTAGVAPTVYWRAYP